MKKTFVFQEDIDRARFELKDVTVRASLAEAASFELNALGKPLISEYDLFRIIWNIYQKRSAKNLRGEYPSRQRYVRTRWMLKNAGVIRQDRDYGGRFWRIMSVSDQPADSIVCVADPYCYVSHMSAMQKYGLTNRRPEALFITSPTDAIVRSWNKNKVLDHYGNAARNLDIYLEPLNLVHHPDQVRKRVISQIKTVLYGDWKQVRGTEERISSIGQVFLDMLEDPSKCGGMRHVIEVWQEHATKYLDQIIKRVDSCDKPILKIRAGYILDELMQIEHDLVRSWISFAQRGGSRVLESGRPYSEPYSEKWMLSVNVGYSKN